MSRAFALALAGVLAAGACNVIALRERALQSEARRAEMDDAIVEVDGDRVALWRGGHGRPVLLLHGFGASALWQWHGQLAALAKQHDVVMPDLLGFGGSSSPAGDPSLDHQVATTLAVLDRLGLERVDVVGISYGGLVAYMLAGAHPDRVRRLVLVDSPGHAWSAADQHAMLARFGVATARELFVPDSPADIRTLVALASYRPQRVPTWAARQVIAELYAPHRSDQIALLSHLERDVDRLASELQRPTAPTLLVWGADDPVFPVAVAHRLEHDLPAELAILEHARHLPNADHPREFNRILLAFLDR